MLLCVWHQDRREGNDKLHCHEHSVIVYGLKITALGEHLTFKHLTLKHRLHTLVLCSLEHMTKSGIELLCSDRQVSPPPHHLSALVFCLNNHLETYSCCSVKTPNSYPFRSKLLKPKSVSIYTSMCLEVGQNLDLCSVVMEHILLLWEQYKLSKAMK